MSFSWAELRLVVLGGILAGLSFAAMPDDWRSGEAIAALPERVAHAVTGEVRGDGGEGYGGVGGGGAGAGGARYGGGESEARGEAIRSSAGDIAHARFSRCSGSVRVNCVVDGDTFWMDGEKIRIADLNAPEVSSPKCASEARLGARATDALIVQLNAGPFTLETIDREEDRYGRKLRRVTRGGESVGDEMVGAGVARWYGEGARGWC